MTFAQAFLLLFLVSSLASVAACSHAPTTRSTNLHPVAGSDEGNEMFKERSPDQ